MTDQSQVISQFPGKSELAKLMRALDWSTTDLPTLSEWPDELSFSIKHCLVSTIPTAIFWGPNFILFYNDAYVPYLDKTKHPFCLGKPGFECWKEIWMTIEPLLKHVYTSSETVKSEDIQLLITNDLFSEYVIIRFTFMPILAVDGNTVKGVFSFCEEVIKQSNRQRKTDSKLNIMNQLHTIATRFVQKDDLSKILLEIIDVAMFITNADKGNLQFVNENGTALNLVASRGFSQPFLDHFAVCTLGKGAYGKALESDERIIVNDITKSPIFVDTPDLQPMLVEKIRTIQSTTLKNRSGKMLGVLSTHHKHVQTSNTSDLQMLDLLARLTADIIEKEQWIQERANWIEKLREADRRKDMFLAILSHELRNPLAAISNSNFILSQLKTAAENDAAKNAQITIDRQLKKITRLVDELLDITRITQNKIQLKRQSIDLNQIVCATITDNYSLFENRDISLETILPPYPLKINADPIRVTQIVSNLLQNASKFSMPGGVTKVFIEEKDKYAELKIIDDGIGIEPDLLVHLFEPFMQADRSLDRSRGGIGLGLALVKGYTELHGGTVSVTSNGPGCGSEFIVRLPLGNSNSVAMDVTQPKQIKSKMSRCVLIIEDNKAVAESLKMVLQIFGHTVHISYDGLDGIQKAKQIKPDFILCDIGLPGVDGYEVAKNIKADSQHHATFLVALSGYAQSEDIEKSRNAGFDLHLPKPPNIDQLKQLLEKERVLELV